MRTRIIKKGKRFIRKGLAVGLCLGQVLTGVVPAMAAPGGIIATPAVPFELPVEVETELGPAGSLKQAPLWKEIVQLLENPNAQSCVPADNTAGRDCTANIVRRPGFGVAMPPLNVYPLDFTVQTGQLLRLRTSDGEISWDQPGPLFAPGEFTDPTTRPIIGYLVVDVDNNLAVSNPTNDPSIPPNGTIVAVPAVNGAGQLVDIDGNVITEFETPINEIDFIQDRTAAEVLGKALFWDMQIGSDGVQSCGSCHFHAGADNRTRNQLNPNHLSGDLTLQLFNNRPVPPANPQNPNQDVVASDFPFHKLANPDIPGEPLLNPGNVVSDANDVMSSMGVRFRQFVDIPPIGTGAGQSFGPAVNGVRALRPDIGTAVADPIPIFQGLRRVEPRNTPTMHSAAFNFDNFWDGRARFHFNGGSVFGASDPFSHIFFNSAIGLQGATNGHIRPDLLVENPEVAAQPVRIKFSSLASQSVGPPLSNFEMSFDGRNWAKIGKKMLQNGVTPLANQLVSTTDSVLGPWSNQGGSQCVALGRPTAANRPGLCTTYVELIQASFKPEFWSNTTQHLNGAAAVCTSAAVNGILTPAGCDPFDGYVLTIAGGPAAPTNRNQFTQMEANFSLFFGIAAQAYEELLIPDDTPFDRFMDMNPRAGFGVGQPGEQGTLPPAQVAGLVGPLTLVPGFGEEELFGFDIFAGANLTAALPVGSTRNPAGWGSNPFLRTGRCMLCHLGPEQTDHTISVAHGLLLSDTEFELPPPGVAEPTGPFKFVTGFSLADELEEVAQDAVEVENRNFSIIPGQVANYPAELAPFATQIGLPSATAFQDNGIYNIGLRPTGEDISRGGPDPFGWPLSLAALAMKNLTGPGYDACDTPGDGCTGPLPNFDPDLGPGGGLFEETGEGTTYPGTTYTLQSINPGLVMEPTEPQMPPYMAPWLNNLPAGELHPQIDELAFAPNHLTHPPFAEFAEIQFGSDFNCLFVGDPNNPADVAANNWGPRCPNTQSAVPNNFDPSLNGTWPFVNRVAREGAFKAPQLRNVEITGPYFHTGSYLTLRQVVDFYLRGGDFPITNAENRDPNLVEIEEQAFGFGSTNALTPLVLDGIPDTFSLYDAMPDTDQPNTPEPVNATQEAAKVALVRFLLSLTDQRVKLEKAPFDRPELFVPLNGTAPDNTGGRVGLLIDPRFRRIPAVGAAGRFLADGVTPDPLPNFLGISSTPVAGPSNDHFDR